MGWKFFRPEKIPALFQHLNITKENVIFWLETHLTSLFILTCIGEQSGPSFKSLHFQTVN